MSSNNRRITRNQQKLQERQASQASASASVASDKVPSTRLRVSRQSSAAKAQTIKITANADKSVKKVDDEPILLEGAAAKLDQDKEL